MNRDLPSQNAELPPSTLDTLGWQPFFANQITEAEAATTTPVRITEIHRSGLHVMGEAITTTLPPDAATTVGDWLLLSHDPTRISRILDRKSLIKRRAPGSDRQVQLIAANIETLFIVSSCNKDFNVARLERFVALALEADIPPVLLLTKADLCADPAAYVAAASVISDQLVVLTLDARSDEPRAKLAPWCKPGQTVAFLGTSGVGKSTLTNALAGDQAIPTQAARADDARGRHTTTHRQLHRMPTGCLVLDTPGMRELQLADAAEGVKEVFSDLGALATECRFSDCVHDKEPGCAVQAAITAGTLDAGRLARWKKLLHEEAFNTASLYERKVMQKTLGKTIRTIQKPKHKRP